MNSRTTVATAASEYLQEYPLSHGQSALWFLYKMDPRAVAYNMAFAAAIPGDTDLDALERAFQRLALRHPMLRTVFAAPGGEPVQRVYPDPLVAFHCENASGWSPSHLDERLASTIYRPFDLEHAPAWRVHVFQGAPVAQHDPDPSGHPEHLILLTLHHIIGDLWSIALLMSDAAAFYLEEVTGVPAQLKPLRTSYADYVYRERERLAGPRGAASWDYWREVLDGDLPSLELPTDHPRPAVQSDRGALHSFQLGREATGRLKALAEERGVSLHTVLLAALQTLLHRYSGQPEILVGFPKAGRSARTARVIGYFINPIVIRGRFAEDPQFSDVLLRTQRAIDESAEHDWYPFPLLVRRLQLPRDLSRSPLFQVAFSWQKTTRLVPKHPAGAFVLGTTDDRAALGMLHMRTVPLPHQTAFFDLAVSAGEVEGGLALTVEYNTDLFNASTITRLAQCYRTLLKSISASPDLPVSRLAILSAEERQRLVVDLNATAAPYPQRCLHQLFEAQVEQVPDVVALECEGEALTYRQLNRRANRLAHYLMQEGVGAESIVGLCCEPSLETIIGALGIMKAGAAYAPIDPYYPPDRQAFMLNEVRAPVLITQARMRDRLPHFAGTVLDLHADGALLEQLPDSNPPTVVTPDSLAYVIFTSGSTGQPKGAALVHRGVVNLLTDFQKRQPIASGDPCSWWTSISFDVSVYEIFSALSAGGSLHVIPQSLRLDAPALLDWLHVHHIRHAYLPPFLLPDFAAWLGRNPDQSEMRRLLVGVEPIPEQLLITIAAQVPGLHVINGYGPSETTICSTLYDVDANRSGASKTPIGKPVHNTQIFLLDRHLEPVPVGVTGELYIGGDGLARGYLHRPDLTAKRFPPNPFAGRPGARFYRTGDLARYLSDGNIEFLGRSDDQLKINGVRIEPAEIEAALTLHPDVHSAAAIARADERGDKHLVAYLVPTGIPPPSPRELRRFLAQRLPSSMLPHTFVVLDELPQTPSGKLDRRRLPAPADVRPRRHRAVRAPGTETEGVLASIWQEVLGIEAIGLNDNFFELGGDSISAMQIVTRAGRTGLHLNPKHLFQAPTIAGLAALADAAGSVHGQPEEGVLDGELPLAPIQHWFFEQAFPSPHHWNQALMFSAVQPIKPLHLRAAVAGLIAHHDSLRLRFVAGPAGRRQGYAGLDEAVPFEVIDLASIPEQRQGNALEAYAAAQQSSLDLSSGPLIRVVYFDLGPKRAGRLLIVIHHLAVDAVSWRILLDDLEAAYHQLERGEAIDLTPKTSPYRDWARRLVDLAHSTQLRQQATSWMSVGTDNPTNMPIDLATADQVGELNMEGTARRLSTRFNQEETHNLLRHSGTARESRVVVVLLTALARAFLRWTGSRSLRVDLEGHGREDLFEGVDLTRTVGWFTSLFPVRLDLPTTENARDCLKAIAHQLQQSPAPGLGYGLLRYLSPDPVLREAMKAIPPAEVVFNNLGRIDPPGDGDLVLALAPESVGPVRSPDAKRPYLLEINAAIIDGGLTVDWTYSSRLHRPETIGILAGFFNQELRCLIADVRSQPISNVAPSLVHEGGHDATVLDEPLQTTGIAVSEGATAAADGKAEAACPISPVQQGMLFHTLVAPDSGVYLQQLICTLEGPLDVQAFSGAWQRSLDRHGILRTAFAGDRLDRMLQIVHRDVRLPLTVRDCRSLSPAEQQARFDALLISERKRRLDLSRAPLWSLILARTSDDVHRLLLNHHHALLDGWSLGLLFQEVFTSYDGLVRGQDPTLPPVRPYRDYIGWLGVQDLAAAEAFWRATLAGCGLGPSLPIQPPPSPALDSRLPAEQEQVFTAAETSALTAWARHRQLTLSTLVHGAWSLLLGRHTGRDEVVYGSTVAVRPPDLAGSESMIGLLINTLPVRVHLDPRAPLVGWLGQRQELAAEARQYDYCPLVQIQTWSGARPGSPLFDSILAFENYPIDARFSEADNALRITDVRAIEQTNYPLAIAATPGRRMRLKVSYDRSRFNPTTVEGLAGDLRRLLIRMTAEPDQRLAEVAELPERLAGRRSTPVGPATLPEPDHVEPKGALQVLLKQLWEEALGIEEIGIEDGFFELGGNSLMAAVVVSKLRGSLSEDIRLSALFEAPTITGLAGYLEQNHPIGVARFLGRPRPATPPIKVLPPTPSPPALVPIQPEGTRPPLFCVHPAGGVVFPYYTLVHHLGEDQPLYGLQDPTLLDAESSLPSIEETAAHYLDVLRTIQPAGPYHLMGWSVGGVIAYEIAQQLSKQGQTVAHLVILDTNAPARDGRHGAGLGGIRSFIASGLRPLVDRVQEIGPTVRPIANYVRSGLFLMAAAAKRRQAVPGGRSTLADLLGWAVLDTWRSRLLGDAEVAGTVSQENSLLLVEMPDVRRVLGKVREHIRIARQYSAGIYPGHVVLIRALRSRPNGRRPSDPSLGWAELAAGGVDIRTIRANHVALMVHPYVESLARELADILQGKQISIDTSKRATGNVAHHTTFDSILRGAPE